MYPQVLEEPRHVAEARPQKPALCKSVGAKRQLASQFEAAFYRGRKGEFRRGGVRQSEWRGIETVRYLGRWGPTRPGREWEGIETGARRCRVTCQHSPGSNSGGVFPKHEAKLASLCPPRARRGLPGSDPGGRPTAAAVQVCVRERFQGLCEGSRSAV